MFGTHAPCWHDQVQRILQHACLRTRRLPKVYCIDLCNTVHLIAEHFLIGMIFLHCKCSRRHAYEVASWVVIAVLYLIFSLRTYCENGRGLQGSAKAWFLQCAITSAMITACCRFNLQGTMVFAAILHAD